MLITFEGIDGSGKSTQATMLEQRLRKKGERVLLVREPGGTELSERVRSILLDPGVHINKMAELLLFSAARSELVEEVLVPALRNDTIVICDRFTDSTLAYQGGGREVAARDWLEAFNRIVTNGLVPMRTYYLAIDHAEAMRRRELREGGNNGDRMEQTGTDFYERIISSYDDIAQTDCQRVMRIDGRLPVGEIHDLIWADLDELKVEG
ncbi:MAG: dTMP kinase [Bacteroidetes bacterium]|nr:dTMP kinase [Bacteroidota bacterium]